MRNANDVHASDNRKGIPTMTLLQALQVLDDPRSTPVQLLEAFHVTVRAGELWHMQIALEISIEREAVEERARAIEAAE